MISGVKKLFSASPNRAELLGEMIELIGNSNDCPLHIRFKVSGTMLRAHLFLFVICHLLQCSDVVHSHVLQTKVVGSFAIYIT